MDAKKTGILIAQCRKAKNYTQKDLAERLHVSDKAISRWETGKGFPDTSLLKPLSDILGIGVSELLAGEMIPREHLSQRVDEVIVDSLHTSKKMQRRGIFWFCLILMVLLLSVIAVALAFAYKPIPADVFVNQSKTYMRYALGKVYDGTIYADLIKTHRSNGHEEALPDGGERYVFTRDEDENLILSYMHCSKEGMLFGFRVGDSTVVKGNESMGVLGYSLVEYLEEQGFRWKHGGKQYGRPTLVYINGERCNWFPYEKDGVYINLCLSAFEGRRLMAYDIGLTSEINAPLWEQMEEGYDLTVEDPFNLLLNIPTKKYTQWEPVTLTAMVQEETYKTLYCYVNDAFVGKLEYVNGMYQITILMPGNHSRVLITPKEKE